MYLLILNLRLPQIRYHMYLHPTMYLLIQSEVIRIIIFNSNLHPTMYLLIPLISCTNINTIVISYPTMYLLIPPKIGYKNTTNLSTGGFKYVLVFLIPLFPFLSMEKL